MQMLRAAVCLGDVSWAVRGLAGHPGLLLATPDSNCVSTAAHVDDESSQWTRQTEGTSDPS